MTVSCRHTPVSVCRRGPERPRGGPQQRMYRRGGGLSSISSGKSVYYMVKVLLALFVGLARRRPVVDPGDRAPVAADHGI